MQKLGFLPEAQNDMIFSIICEELGLFGAFAIIVMFILLIWRFMVIANNAKDLFGAGIRIGQDMIGTMSNTLILAYVGTALTTMLVLLSYGYQTQQLLNSDYLTVELTGSICSTMGVILTVPIASAISAFLYRRQVKARI